MNTLATMAPLLERLFAEADVPPGEHASFKAMSADQLDRLINGQDDYLELYGRLGDVPLAVSRETGALLYMLARATKARSVVEFGTSFGISTLHLAAAVRDNGGGRVITSEFAPEKIARARAHLTEGGVIDLVELRAGDALETLAKDLPEAIDLVLLDGAKSLYPKILALLEPHLAPGALIVADNADKAPDYLKLLRSADYLSVPFDAEVELSMRLR